MILIPTHGDVGMESPLPPAKDVTASERSDDVPEDVTLTLGVSDAEVCRAGVGTSGAREPAQG